MSTCIGSQSTNDALVLLVGKKMERYKMFQQIDITTNILSILFRSKSYTNHDEQKSCLIPLS